MRIRQDGRGGRREGAGRPPKAEGERRKLVTLRLHPELIARLEAYRWAAHLASRGAAVERLLEAGLEAELGRRPDVARAFEVARGT